MQRAQTTEPMNSTQADLRFCVMAVCCHNVSFNYGAPLPWSPIPGFPKS